MLFFSDTIGNAVYAWSNTLQLSSSPTCSADSSCLAARDVYWDADTPVTNGTDPIGHYYSNVHQCAFYEVRPTTPATTRLAMYGGYACGDPLEKRDVMCQTKCDIGSME